MSQVGDRLRATREARGVTIAQVTAQIRILPHHLEALEQGRFASIPGGDVYVRGFLRNYATYLQLPADEIISGYQSEVSASVAIPPSVKPAMSGLPKRPFSIPNGFVVLFVVLMMAGVSYLALNASGNLPSTSTVSIVQELPTLIPTETPRPAPTATAVVVAVKPTSPIPVFDSAGSEPPVLQATATPTPTVVAPVILDVRTDPGNYSGAWMEIRTDGKTVFRKILPAGQALHFEAQRNVWIRTGNAGVVVATVNGQEHRLGSRQGEVVTFTWPR